MTTRSHFKRIDCARLAEPALVPDYLIEPQFDDYVGRRDIWQAKLIDIIEQ